MIDYEVGDIVMGITGSRNDILGKVYEVMRMDGRSDTGMPLLREIKTDKEVTGWYAYRFMKYQEGDEGKCRFCKSNCKAEEPCGFYQSIVEVIT